MKYSAIILLVICTSAMGAELVPLKSYLKKELAGAAKISKESFALDASHKKQLEKIVPDAQDLQFTFYFARNAEGQLTKACTVVPQQGKEGPLSIGTCFDANGMITGVTVLSSEEERGKQITEANYLKQFNGKKISNSFVVGKDVDGVSGATYSSKSLAEALRKSAYAFKTFVKGKQ